MEGDNEGFGVGELLGESDGYEMFKHEIHEIHEYIWNRYEFINLQMISYSPQV